MPRCLEVERIYRYPVKVSNKKFADGFTMD